MGLEDLRWRDAPDLAARLGDEGWPLLDAILEEAPAPPPATDQRRAALEALIQAAFGP